MLNTTFQHLSAVITAANNYLFKSAFKHYCKPYFNKHKDHTELLDDVSKLRNPPDITQAWDSHVQKLFKGESNGYFDNTFSIGFQR